MPFGVIAPPPKKEEETKKKSNAKKMPSRGVRLTKPPSEKFKPIEKTDFEVRNEFMKWLESLNIDEFKDYGATLNRIQQRNRKSFTIEAAELLIQFMSKNHWQICKKD